MIPCMTYVSPVHSFSGLSACDICRKVKQPSSLVTVKSVAQRDWAAIYGPELLGNMGQYNKSFLTTFCAVVMGKKHCRIRSANYFSNHNICQ